MAGAAESAPAPGRLSAVALLVLLAMGAVGLWRLSDTLRAERAQVAVDRFRAHPFGVGRGTRFEARYKTLAQARGKPAFEAEAPPWVWGAVRVTVRFAGDGAAEAPAFAVSPGEEGADVVPLNAPGEALAAALARPPSGPAPNAK